MKILISERQLKRLKEDSLESETSTTLSNLSTTADMWQQDLGGKYLKRYKRNNKDYVKRVQTMLTLLGYDVGHYGDGEPVIDGIYGPDSVEAVREFQKDTFVEPIEWDGIVGPKTYTELWNEVGELGDEHAMTVDEIILLGLDDENIMGDDDDVHYKGDEDEEEEESEETEFFDVDETEVDRIGREVVAKASERIGEPYKWGGTFDGTGGDCSGLVDWTFRHVEGVDSPGRDTTSTLKREEGFKSGKDNYDEVKPGDILLFDGKKYRHTGIVTDVNGGKVSMIHSAGSGWDKGTKRGVQITDDTFYGHNYFRNNYMGYVPLEYFMVDKEKFLA